MLATVRGKRTAIVVSKYGWSQDASKKVFIKL